MIVSMVDTAGAPVEVETDFGCSFGCGNVYQFVVVTVDEGTTQFLCVPCFVKTAMQLVQVMTDPGNAAVEPAFEDEDPNTVKLRRARKNHTDATANLDDFDTDDWSEPAEAV